MQHVLRESGGEDGHERRGGLGQECCVDGDGALGTGRSKGYWESKREEIKGIWDSNSDKGSIFGC